MTFDEMYDQMLSREFSNHGRHAKVDTVADPAAAVAVVVASQDLAHARHAKAGLAEADTAETDTAETVSERERPTGLARYRTAALVGAGGLACATVGAFLGGLGGYFTVSPAGAHAVASTSQDSPLADAINHVAHAAHSTNANAALAAATFSAVSGGLTRGWADPAITTGYPSTLAVQGGPTQGSSGSGDSGGGTTGGDNGGNGGGSIPLGGDNGGGCTDQLTCLIDGLTGALPGIGTPSDPTGMLSGLLTEVTSTLSGLGALLSGPLPVATGGGLPVSGLVSSGGLPGGVTSAGPAGSSSGQGSPVPIGTGSLGTVLSGVSGAVGGSTAPLSSLPSPTSTGTPITTSVPLPTSTGTTTPTVSGSTGTTVTVPLPVPTTTDPVTVGPVTVGTTSGTSSSTGGLTLNLGGL